MANLSQALARHASAAGAQIAMSDGRRSLTRSELVGWVGGVAHDLGPAPRRLAYSATTAWNGPSRFSPRAWPAKRSFRSLPFSVKVSTSHLIRDAGIARVILTDGQSSNGVVTDPALYRLAELAGAGPSCPSPRRRTYHLHLGQHRKPERRLACERSSAVVVADFSESYRRQQRRQVSVCFALAAAS